MEIPDKIRCVECGGTAHLLVSIHVDEPVESGEILPYRCADCMDRFDIVFDDEDDGDGPSPPP